MTLDTFLAYCLNLPGTNEGFPFGEPTLVLKVMDKIFALTDADKFESINLKCDPEKAIELRERYDAVQPGYHMNKKHWNTIVLDGSIPNKLILQWTKDSYDLVAASLSVAKRNEIKNIR